jgi:hypothetical protein
MTAEPAIPGDEPETAGSGENICWKCSGSGQINGGGCLDCGATGWIVAGIGRA